MGLFRNISLQQLYRGAVHTFLKYPLVLLSATTGTIAAIIRIDIPYDKQQLYPYLDKLILVSALGLILFFVLELVVRRYKFSLAERIMLWVAGLLFLMLYFLLLPGYMEERQYLRFLILELVLHLAASYAMFVNQREENAFWQFNKTLFLQILTSALYAAVLFIGLTIAVAAVDKLFSVNVPDISMLSSGYVWSVFLTHGFFWRMCLSTCRNWSRVILTLKALKYLRSLCCCRWLRYTWLFYTYTLARLCCNGSGRRVGYRCWCCAFQLPVFYRCCSFIQSGLRRAMPGCVPFSAGFTARFFR